jgi:hypothetical protein
MRGFCRSAFCFLLVFCFSSLGLADTLNLTCDTTVIKPNPISHRHLDSIEITLSRNFDQISAQIIHTMSDGERLSVPPYEHLIHFDPTNWSWIWTTQGGSEPDGKHYVISLVRGGDYILTENAWRSDCDICGRYYCDKCLLYGFTVSCFPAN